LASSVERESLDASTSACASDSSSIAIPKPIASSGITQDNSGSKGASHFIGIHIAKPKFHCTFCKKDGHTVEFCFHRVKHERRVRAKTFRKSSCPLVAGEQYRQFVANPFSAGNQFAHRTLSNAQYDLGPCVRGFEGQRFRGPHFAYRGAHYPQRRNNGYETPFAANPVLQHVSQRWINSSFLANQLGSKARAPLSSHM